jgi:subtilase family serine protease
VKKTGKKKTEYITLIAMVKEGKTLLKLDNVSHWPTVFNSGEKVTTSCSISNNGTVSARNVKVFFYLNGKQKNMVEVTIPTGSIADLQIPWMAVKGKNQVRIRLKE